MQDFPEGAQTPQWRDNLLFGIILSKNYMRGHYGNARPSLSQIGHCSYINDIEIELQEEFCWSWHDMHVSRLLPTHNLFNLL